MACTPAMAASSSPRDAATAADARMPVRKEKKQMPITSRRFFWRKSRYSSGASEKEKGDPMFHFSAATQPQRLKKPVEVKPKLLDASTARIA